jgi:hypothetical protein
MRFGHKVLSSTALGEGGVWHTLVMHLFGIDRVFGSFSACSASEWRVCGISSSGSQQLVSVCQQSKCVSCQRLRSASVCL